MSSYLATFGSPSAASVAVTPVAVETVAPVPPANDDPIIVAAPASKRQRTLDDFWSPSASVSAAPATVDIVAPYPLANDDPIVVAPPVQNNSGLYMTSGPFHRIFLACFSLFP